MKDFRSNFCSPLSLFITNFIMFLVWYSFYLNFTLMTKKVKKFLCQMYSESLLLMMNSNHLEKFTSFYISTMTQDKVNNFQIADCLKRLKTVAWRWLDSCFTMRVRGVKLNETSRKWGGSKGLQMVSKGLYRSTLLILVSFRNVLFHRKPIKESNLDTKENSFNMHFD